ncbi:hypothetical protein [Ktedonobacter racemifer]|uniref:hypothetical protein n=1 Tax=Ktedonobacter racemifer TaxID=363277 RepID=UPI00058F78D6|nr:hypothetical protein [Ktedonobacter racemifer]
MCKPSLTRVHLGTLARALPGMDAHLVSIAAQQARAQARSTLTDQFLKGTRPAASARSVFTQNGDCCLGDTGLGSPAA